TLNRENELKALPPLRVAVETSVTLPLMSSRVAVRPSGTICCAGACVVTTSSAAQPSATVPRDRRMRAQRRAAARARRMPQEPGACFAGVLAWWLAVGGDKIRLAGTSPLGAEAPVGAYCWFRANAIGVFFVAPWFFEPERGPARGWIQATIILRWRTLPAMDAAASRRPVAPRRARRAGSHRRLEVTRAERGAALKERRAMGRRERERDKGKALLGTSLYLAPAGPPLRGVRPRSRRGASNRLRFSS